MKSENSFSGSSSLPADRGTLKPYILLVGIPFVGHLNPLLVQAEELQKRGIRVSIASFEPIRAHVEQHPGALTFLSLGDPPVGIQETEQLLLKASAEPSWIKNSALIINPLEKLWPAMFDELRQLIRQDRPDLMVIDFAALGALDLSEAEHIPVIINNPDILSVLPIPLFPPAPEVPNLLSGRSIHQMKGWQRLISAVERRFLIWVAEQLLNKQNNRLRRSRGLAKTDALRRLAGTTILVNGSFGIEYERKLPPFIHMVGPMLPQNHPPLPAAWDTWLNEGKPVVYVNLGTLSSPPAEQLQRMADGLRSDEFRVLWVMRPAVQARLPELLPENIRIESWVPSPISILRHSQVKVFVTHCGVNSVYESVDAGTPMIGIPMFAAQRDMGLRVQDAGAGILLDKSRFTAKVLQESINQIMNDSFFMNNVIRIGSDIRRIGGVNRAADLIELELDKNITKKAATLQRYNRLNHSFVM
jgi:UDP:flavonoid glycosyltransferase YjiC (YdhE family)